MSGWIAAGGVLVVLVVALALALAVIRNPGAFVYNLMKAALPDVWTMLQLVLPKILASSEKTQAANQKRVRQGEERGGKDR